jgi:hypothetical protein
MRIPYLICALMLFCGDVYGQWNTNLWPSWETQFNGKKRAWQVYSGLVETVDAAHVDDWVGSQWSEIPNPPTAPFFFTQRSRLISYKNITREMLEADIGGIWVDWTYTNAAGNFNTYFQTNTAYFDPPRFTVNSLCDLLDIPTNYFDYTPWFQLNGLGSNGITNDNFGGIGHQFGRVNTKTAAGGAFFPVGRTNVWFTTDYGWVYMRSVLDALVMTMHPHNTNVGVVVDQSNTRTLRYIADITFTNATWAGARALMTNHWKQNANWGNVAPLVADPAVLAFRWGTNASGHYHIELSPDLGSTEPNDLGRFEITDLSAKNTHSSIWFTAQLYSRAGTNSFFGAAVMDHYFDFTGVLTNYNTSQMLLSTGPVNIIGDFNWDYGGTNDTIRDSFIDFLPAASQTHSLSNFGQALNIQNHPTRLYVSPLGFVGKTPVVVRWDVTNGFKYVAD